MVIYLVHGAAVWVLNGLLVLSPFFKKRMKYYSSFFATGVHKVKFRVQVLGLVYFRKYTKRKGYWINELGIKVSDRKQKRIDHALWSAYKDAPALREL